MNSKLKALLLWIFPCAGVLHSSLIGPGLPWIPPVARWIFGIMTVLGYTLLYFQAQEKIKCDPREPDIVSNEIPYVAHLIGILHSGSNYFKRLG